MAKWLFSMSGKKKSKAETVTDFGSRQLNKQNFSRTVVLPKTALKNCGCDLNDKDLKVNISLVQKNDERFIKVVPICTGTEEVSEDE